MFYFYRFYGLKPFCLIFMKRKSTADANEKNNHDNNRRHGKFT